MIAEAQTADKNYFDNIQEMKELTTVLLDSTVVDMKMSADGVYIKVTINDNHDQSLPIFKGKSLYKLNYIGKFDLIINASIPACATTAIAENLPDDIYIWFFGRKKNHNAGIAKSTMSFDDLGKAGVNKLYLNRCEAICHLDGSVHVLHLEGDKKRFFVHGEYARIVQDFLANVSGDVFAQYYKNDAQLRLHGDDWVKVFDIPDNCIMIS